MPTITNFNVDSIASGVAAPVGPLTRVTDMSTLPTPNENHTIEFTTALSGISAFMTFEQLADSDVRARILSQVGGVSERAQRIKTAVAAMYAVTNPLTSPHTYEDYVDMITAVRDNLDFLKGYY